LQRQGYDIGGKADGKFGLATRAGVKQAQLKFGMPADSYPTADLIARLRGGTAAAAPASAPAPRATGTARPKAPSAAPSRPRPPGQ
jgi:peptidoglycan hydrolase-like protein with peptidoglycan-binding domain